MCGGSVTAGALLLAESRGAGPHGRVESSLEGLQEPGGPGPCARAPPPLPKPRGLFQGLLCLLALLPASP